VQEVRKREFFEKPAQKRRRKKKEAIARTRKYERSQQLGAYRRK